MENGLNTQLPAVIRLHLFTEESLSGHNCDATVGLNWTMALQQLVELRRKHSTANDDWSWFTGTSRWGTEDAETKVFSAESPGYRF